MRAILNVARYEYTRHVRRRGFLLTAVGVPLGTVALIAVVALVIANSGIDSLGLVDRAGITENVELEAPGSAVAVRRFADEATARAALDRGEVEVVAVVPTDYLDTGVVRSIGPRGLGDRGEDLLADIVRAGLLERAPPQARERLENPSQVTLRTLDGREVDADSVLLFAVPYLFAVLFMLVTFTTSGYLLQAVAEEKENRVMEILATTLSPPQMMAGKILGLSGVAMTQLGAWLLLAVAGIAIWSPDLGWLRGTQFPLSLLGWSLLFFVLGYFLFAGCYLAIGAAVTNPQEAQPLAAPISLLAAAPFWLLLPILAQPNGPIAVILSLIPFSASITMLMRLPLAEIPLWQLGLSLLLLAASAVGAVWLSARVLRRGMLRYGKRLSLREIFS